MNVLEESALKNIEPADLICIQPNKAELRVDLAYAQDDNLLFGERIYRKDTALYLHKMLADIVFQAGCLAADNALRLVLYDGLRTCSAQAKMLETRAVRDHPQWLEEPRMLSTPGAGAHPRGMAIDCSLETLDGSLLDMGTAFDFLSDDPSPAHNPAHREYKYGSTVTQNRALLDDIMLKAARACKTPLMLLPQEWWDFRLPPDIYERYAPLSDDDLPVHIRNL